MEFPRLKKRPEDLLRNDEQKLGTKSKISLNIMLIGSMLFRPAASDPQAAPTPSQQPQIEPQQFEAKVKLIRIGKRLQQFLSVLDRARFFQHRSHYSHYSHVSHSSHYSHYSGSPPPPPPVVLPAVSIITIVRGLSVTFEASENSYVPSHDTHYWDFGDGTTFRQRHSDGHTVVHTYSRAGSYQVTLQLMANGTVTYATSATVLVTGR